MAARGRGKFLPSAQHRDQLPGHGGHNDLKTWLFSPRDLEQVVWGQRLTLGSLRSWESLSHRSQMEGLTSASREVMAPTQAPRDPSTLSLWSLWRLSTWGILQVGPEIFFWKKIQPTLNAVMGHMTLPFPSQSDSPIQSLS